MTGHSAPEDNWLVNLAKAYSRHSPIIRQVLGGIIFSLAVAFVTEWVKLPLNSAAEATPLADNASTDTGSELVDVPPTMFSFPWSFVPFGLIVGGGLTAWGTISGSKDKEDLVKRGEAAEVRILNLTNELMGNDAKLKYLTEQLKTHTDNNYQLVSEVYEAYKSKISLWLTMVSQELGFGEHHRITIYYIDGNKESLLPLERYSKGPVFNAPGRPKFPIGKCAISNAWTNGNFFCDNIPNHIQDKRSYNSFLKREFGYDQKTIDGLNMHCQAIGGFAVVDPTGHHVGVVVFESMETDLNEVILQELCRRENGRVLRFIQETQRREDALASFRDRNRKSGGA